MIFATLRGIQILFFRFLGGLFFYIFKKRRNIAIANIKRCKKNLFGEDRKGENREHYIVKKSFANLGQTLADFLLLRWYTKKNIDRYVFVKNKGYVKDALAKKRGVIISTAHFGSWELAAHCFALHNFKSLILYNKIKKPMWLEGWVKKQRERSGNRLLAKQNSFLSLYKHIKKGGIVTLLSDQHAFPPEGELFSFLGEKAWCHTTFVKLSLRTGTPIIPSFMFNKGLFRYEVRFFEPINPKDFTHMSSPVQAMTQKTIEVLESVIREVPELWMWQHRRFKKIKPLVDLQE